MEMCDLATYNMHGKLLVVCSNEIHSAGGAIRSTVMGSTKNRFLTIQPFLDVYLYRVKGVCYCRAGGVLLVVVTDLESWISIIIIDKTHSLRGK